MGGADAEALTEEGARVHRGIGGGDAEILGVQTMYCWGDGKEAQSISTMDPLQRALFHSTMQ